MVTLLLAVLVAGGVLGAAALGGPPARPADHRTVVVELTVGDGPQLLVQQLEAERRRTPEELFDALRVMALHRDTYTFPCEQLLPPYADLGVGAPVTVHDRDGAVVATARLTGGIGHWEGCTFRVEVALPMREVYLLEVGDRPPIELARSVLPGDDEVLPLRLPEGR